MTNYKARIVTCIRCTGVHNTPPGKGSVSVCTFPWNDVHKNVVSLGILQFLICETLVTVSRQKRCVILLNSPWIALLYTTQHFITRFTEFKVFKPHSKYIVSRYSDSTSSSFHTSTSTFGSGGTEKTYIGHNNVKWVYREEPIPSPYKELCLRSPTFRIVRCRFGF